LTLLDVGQGLAAVIRTENHTLVFDAGPRFSSTFDTGQAVLVPFLRHQGVTRLDMLVVSHGDNDHIGGVDSLLAAFPAGRIISSVPEELSGNPVTPCRQGDVWQWDGVDFSVLYPGVEDTRTGNNASCVLRVEVPGGRTVLLTGDIERAAELSLLRNQHDALKTDILVVPHHGSKTSSSLPFVQAARPAVALFPVGHLNRYRLPNPEVVDRYAALGAEMYETGETGAITLSLVPGMPQPELHLYREESPRYWRPAD
jgi:competence protein ComEC